ncbi:uncharacterized protein LOC131668464 [Phymastichus coffea]|uniref:uncharacterized protein LOC131668464 n=1 Tax=Phymastichus coffea TaxID=108790 RepID=UPI00273CE341|nr:uncharacterized protein LOC131668464 [Phymastichus coffea]
MEYVVNGKVKDLQAALFPVQPIPEEQSQKPKKKKVKKKVKKVKAKGNSISNQCLQTRFGIERKDLDSVLTLANGLVKAKDGFLQGGDANFDAVARWPTECQVLGDRVRHLDYSPAEPEVFYIPSGKEPRPKPVGEESGETVFQYCPAGPINYFSRSCIGGSAVELNNERNGEQPPANVNNLAFESRFESGNLGKVIKITDTYYQLHLRKDLYTQRHMQWYYFRITNTRSNVMYRLSIVNMCKEDSLYNEGLRPLMYSEKEATSKKIGWRRCGENICYYKNDSSDEEKEKHTLTFNVYFPHDQDTVYLAHCYPYTYTDLQEYLGKIANDPIKARFTKLRLLCRSLAGNAVYYLTITAPQANDDAQQRKKGVVITARVHPGETPSSWIMKGIIDFLTGESNQARELRERFIFKLVPMLNPDGVIVGNNRCSLAGKDLNRQYRTVLRESYPSVWHTKLMIRRLMEECGIAMYCDLHAHSRKHNIFIYGCESKRAGYPGKLAEQVFPLMLHKNAADKFSFENCKFHIEKNKEGTGRVVVWLMGIQNSYTMEASLGGSRLGSRNGTHFSTQDYEQVGKAFCETLLDFSDSDPIKEKLRSKIIARLAKEGSSADEPTNIDLTDYSSDEGDTSESSSEDDKYNGDVISRRLSACSEDRRYLCVPPPSPMLLKPATADSLGKIKKPKATLPRSVLPRRKTRNRTAMDLPTTDPGSDLYDMTDSGDETNARSAAENQGGRSSGDESRLYGKENRVSKKSDINLPAIVRPRSLSLGEEIIEDHLCISATSVFFTLLVPALVLYYIYFRVSRAHMLELAEKIPGPKGLPLLGNALELLGSSDTIFRNVYARSFEFDQVIKLWVGPKLVIFLIDPRDIEVILSSHVYIDKASEYRFFEPWLGNGLLISTGQKWRAHRKLIAPTFHLNVLKSFIDLFNANSRAVVGRMREEGTKEFDIHDYMSETTVEILLETAMGVSKSTQDKSGYEYAMAVMKMCDILHMRHTRPWLRLDWVFSLTKYGKEQVRLLDIIHGLTKKVVAKKKEDYKSGKRNFVDTGATVKDVVKSTTVVEGLSFGQSAGLKDDLDVDDNDIGEKKRQAFLDLLIESSQNGVVLTDEEVKEQVDTIMFEGHDTTAAGSSFFLSMMGCHPDIQEKVIQEIDEIFGDSDRPATFQDTLEMKYLERCLMETLRMYPPVPFIAREIKTDLKLASGDYTIPAGCTVAIGTFKLHRQPHIYPNPDVFNPDNFLPEKTANRHYYAFIPFSAGPRSCVGRKYAMLKLKILLSTILRNFRVKSTVKEEDFRLQADIILKRAEGFKVKLEPRTDRGRTVTKA